MEVGINFTRGAATALIPPNLVASISPATTSQSTPGAVVLTASATGGTGAQTWAWVATYADGTSAAALLSALVGSSVTLTTTAYYAAVRVVATATDAAGQTSSASALVEVGAPAALVSGADLSATSLASGTTTTSFTFDAATGGGGAISYALTVESSTGTVTLSTSSGRTASLLGLTDGATVRVTCTATDSVGQSDSSTGVWGVAVAPVYEENALWVPVEEIDYRTLGSGSRSGTGTLVVGGVTFTVTSPAAATGIALVVDSSGAKISQSSGVGTASNVYTTFPVGLANFAPMENILFDAVITVASIPTSGFWVAGFGDGTYYGANDFFGCQGGAASSADTGPMNARRFQASTATNQPLASGQTLSGTYAIQVLMVGQRIAMCSLSRASDYLGGPRLGTSTPMRGVWSGSPGGQGVTNGSSITSAFNTYLRASWAVISGATSVTMVKCRLSRLTRPPSV